MKVIKLDNRHRLYKEGFKFGFRFDGYTKEYSTVESAFTKKYGTSWNNQKCWGTFWSKPSRDGKRVLWIGVREESLISQLLLSLK